MIIRLDSIEGGAVVLVVAFVLGGAYWSHDVVLAAGLVPVAGDLLGNVAGAGHEAQPDAEPSRGGDLLRGHFRVADEVGQGRAGTVYQAAAERVVAVYDGRELWRKIHAKSRNQVNARCMKINI